MMKAIKNSRMKIIINIFVHYFMCHEHAKDVAYLIFLNIHKHFKTQDVFHGHIPPSCPQGLGDLLRK